MAKAATILTDYIAGNFYTINRQRRRPHAETVQGPVNCRHCIRARGKSCNHSPHERKPMIAAYNISQ